MSAIRLLSPILAFVSLFSLTATAGAELSVYGTAMLSNFGFSNGSSSSLSFKGDTGGFGGGAFYNFPIQSRLSAGIDTRASYSPGSKGGTSAAAALRVAFIPHQVRLRPYIQIGGGVVSSETYNITPGSGTAITRNRVTSGALEIVGGLDIRLTEVLDLRAVEYGAAAGASSSGASAGFGFLGAGLVYHLHPKAPH